MIYQTIALALLPLTLGCPGSPAFMHAKCEMGLSFENSCDAVLEEMSSRINSDWVDPHNGGIYSMTSMNSTSMTGQRVTGDGKYTDLFDFSLQSSGSGCEVDACSESQVNSIKDYSTNYCNLHSLYCSSADGCTVVKTQLSYEEKYTSCSQHDDVCVAQSYLKVGNTQCQSDIDGAKAELAKAEVPIQKAIVDCANPKDGVSDECTQDIQEAATLAKGAVPFLEAALVDCVGEFGPACTADIDAIKADMDGVQAVIQLAITDCSEGGSDINCKKDLANIAAYLTAAKPDIEAAVADCKL